MQSTILTSKYQSNVCECLFDLSEKARQDSRTLVPFATLSQRVVQLVVRAARYGPSFGLPLWILCGDSNTDYRYGHWRVKQSARVIKQKLYLKIVCVRPVRDLTPAKWLCKVPKRDKCSKNCEKGLPLCSHFSNGYSPNHANGIENALWLAFERCRNLDTFKERILDFGISHDCKRCHSDYLLDMIKEYHIVYVRVTRWTCLGDGISPIDRYWSSLVVRDEIRSRPGRMPNPQAGTVRSRGEARKLFEIAETTDKVYHKGL